ncbi:MAG TPA: 1-acyl-sn-glycerol-3-phosphate acyltransferase [Kofleriaceae bacterium]|nr:1-acyl-sn-glycerol-3-phosphate acyltransferase [Kofleriaceae bacterium]
MRLYRGLRWLLGLAMRVFFRQVEVVGLEHVPARGAVLFAGNHPNSLIDPILILTTCGRIVHFAAKDTLFTTRIMRWLLRGLGAVPVARRDDHGAGADNQAAFTAMFRTLGEGRAIGIFPEGLSHDASQLARLKTGAARLALGAAARGTAVTIVPCGLTFIHPRAFRSRALVQYGPPIVIPAEASPAPAPADADADADAVAAARTLTERIDRALRGLTVNAVDWDTIRLLDAVRRLYQPPAIEIEDRVELARRFNTHYPKVKDRPEVVHAMQRVRRYQGRLDELGVADREIAGGLAPRAAARRVLRNLALVFFWLPLMLPGALLHLPAVGLARLAGKKLTPRKDVIATTKVLAGMAIVFTFYAAAAVGLAWWKGWPWAVAAAIVLPVSGYATLKVIDRFYFLRRGAGALWRSLRLQREARALEAERSALTAELIELVDALKPADLVPLFPREVPREAAAR